MKRIVKLGALCAAALVHAAVAQEQEAPGPNWTKVTTSDVGQCVYYLDGSTIAPKGKFKKVWSLQSCDEIQPAAFPGNAGHYSQLTLWYIDCREQAYMVGQVIAHAGGNGAGEVTESSSRPLSEKGFEDAAPGSVGLAIVQAVCRAR